MKQLSPVTEQIMDVLTRTLDLLRDELELEGLSDEYESLLKQASDYACVPYEDRKYRIVKVAKS